MKRYITLALSVLMVLNSCSQMLDIYPRSAISPDGVTANDLSALRYGVYAAMQNKPGTTGYMCFDVLGGDITKKNYNPIDLYNGYMKTLGSNVTDQWNSSYNELYHVNVLLAAVEKAGIEANKVIYGEAHYFRAMIYMNLVTRWGGVPILRVNTSDRVARDTVEDCWDFINEELQLAIDNLETSTDMYMVSKEAAQALAARAYLYQGNMKKAAEFAEGLITSGKYALEKDFSKIFGYERKANSETIFAFNMDDTETSIKLGSQYFTYDYVNKGSGGYFPTQTIINLFDANDTRLPVSVVTVGTDKCMGKYPGGQAYSDPIIISRIGEIYLISAEALGFPDGCERLNQLRRMRGLSDSTASSEAELKEAVLQERRLELLGENLIWYDYIRQGKAVERLGITKTQTLFPIPEGEIRENPLLKQNPGWGGNEL